MYLYINMSLWKGLNYNNNCTYIGTYILHMILSITTTFLFPFALRLLHCYCSKTKIKGKKKYRVWLEF